MLFSSLGYETSWQDAVVVEVLVCGVPGWKWPVGQVTATAVVPKIGAVVGVGRFAAKTALCWMATKPAGWGHVVVAAPVQTFPPVVLVPPWLARGAPRVLKRIPAEPVLEL